MKTADAAAEFLVEQRVRGNSRHTIDYYRRILKGFSAYAAYLSSVTLPACRAYCMRLTESGLSTVSVQSYVRGLRAFLTWLYENEYINENIPAKLRLPKARRGVIDILTDRELSRLIAVFDESNPLDLRNLCVCSLMFDSGLRLSETVRLAVRGLHLPERYLIVTGKGNKQRRVPVGETTAARLERYTAFVPSGGALFLKEDGEPIGEATIKDMFRKLRYRSDIPRLHPHLLRHTFATRYLENGGNIYSLQSILGHTSLEMVKRYLHLADSRIIRDFSRFSPADNLAVSE